MTAEQFRPKFTTSVEAAEKRREARERVGKNFHQRVSVTEGVRPPSNVRPAPMRFEAVQQALDFDSIQEERDKEIAANQRRLKAAEERRKKGID